MNIRDNNLFEIDYDIDTMNLIKAQSKKIRDLYEDINYKENIISTLKKENNIMNEHAYVNQELKNKISSLEKQLDLSKLTLDEKEDFIQNQIKQISDLEKQINNKLNHKDKVITEKENLILELRNTIKKQKGEIENQSDKINKMVIQKDELNLEFKNQKILLEINQNEIKKYKKNSDDHEEENENLKKNFEKKVHELVDLIKSQNNELNNFSIKINTQEKENKELKSTITMLEHELDLLNSNLYEMNCNLQNQNNLIENYKSKEKVLFSLEKELNIEKEKNSKLNTDLSILTENYNNLNNKYSGENSLENLYNIISSKEEQIFNLEKNIEIQNGIISDKDIQLKENESEIQIFIKYINSFLGTSIAWADTYLGVYTDKNISNLTIPDLKFNEFEFNSNPKFLNEIVNKNLEDFCENLNKIRIRLHEDLHFFNENFAKFNAENKHLLDKIKNLNDEIYSLKNELEKSRNQNMVDKNNLNNMRNDLRFYHEKINSLEKICEEENNISKKILADINKEYEILYEIIRSNSKFKCYSDYLSGFKFDSDSNIAAQNIIDVFRCLCELDKIILKDFEQSFKKLDELQSLKRECDELRRDFIEANKLNKTTIDKIKSENVELKNNYEQIRNNQLNKTEESYKKKIEELRQSLKEKDESLMFFSQDNNILKSQLEILEKNMNSFKINSRETEENFQNKIIDLNENLKGIESTNTQLKNEYDLLKLRYENSENNYRKKILELEENKKKFHEIQTNFNFYNDKSNNSQMKLINNEKEKSEILNKEVDRLKIENKELIENNIILKEEIKKLIESNKLGRSFAKENKNIGQEEQMEILLKGYKEQMKKYEEELRDKDLKINNLLREGSWDQNRNIYPNKIKNTKNTTNEGGLNNNFPDNHKNVEGENIYQVDYMEPRGFLSNLNTFVNRENQI